MKIRANMSVGDWRESVDIDYNSESESDCVQADKFVSRVLSVDAPESDGTGEPKDEEE